MKTASAAPTWRTWILSLTLVAFTACGGGGGSGEGADPAEVLEGNFFPLSVGDRWVYADDLGRNVMVRGVRLQEVGEQTGVRVETQDQAGGITESVLLRSASGVVELPLAGDALGQAIGPVQVMRFPVVANDSFVQVDQGFDAGIEIAGDGVSEWLLVRSDVQVLGLEAVDTPMGRIAGCLHQRNTVRLEVRYSRGSTITVDSQSDTWYGPDIGPVRSTVVVSSLGMTESRTMTLVAYQVGLQSSAQKGGKDRAAGA